MRLILLLSLILAYGGPVATYVAAGAPWVPGWPLACLVASLYASTYLLPILSRILLGISIAWSGK